MTRIMIAIEQLKIWALKNFEPPKHTSFHVAALLYRDCLLINLKNGNLIAAVNSKSLCAERELLRMLLRLFERSKEKQYIKEGIFNAYYSYIKQWN